MRSKRPSESDLTNRAKQRKLAATYCQRFAYYLGLIERYGSQTEPMNQDPNQSVQTTLAVGLTSADNPVFFKASCARKGQPRKDQSGQEVQTQPLPWPSIVSVARVMSIAIPSTQWTWPEGSRSVLKPTWFRVEPPFGPPSPPHNCPLNLSLRPWTEAPYRHTRGTPRTRPAGCIYLNKRQDLPLGSRPESRPARTHPCPRIRLAIEIGSGRILGS